MIRPACSEVQTGCVAVKQARQEVFKLPAGQCFVGVCGFCAACLTAAEYFRVDDGTRSRLCCDECSRTV